MSTAEAGEFPRRPSITDVALRAGVSKGAVSKVIRDAYGVSPAMRARVQAAIDELDYRPRTAARSMRGASFTIGFEVPNLGNDLFSQVVSGVAQGVAASNYQLIVAPSFDYLSPTTVIDGLVDRQVDGMIAVSYQVTTEWLEKRSGQIPVVILGRHDASVRYDTVTCDDDTGTSLVMNHLQGLGHRQIALVTTQIQSPTTPQAVRESHYLEHMKRAGTPPQVIHVTGSEQSGYDAAAQLLQQTDRPTAIFASYDTLAIGVLRAVADHGLTAADVSVAGYDNIDIAGHPLISLTTVDQFGEQMGRVAAQLLLERIRDGRKVAVHHRIKPELRIRNSTRPAST